MSQENVEVVGRLFALWGRSSSVDALRDDLAWPDLRTELEGVFAPDCVCTWIGFDEPLEATGLDGQRAAWLELLKPWYIVHTDAELLHPVGDKVVALTRQHGRRVGARKGIEVIGAAVYLARYGRIVRADHYARRTEALEAVGLREHELPQENFGWEWFATKLEALDPRGTAMFTLPGATGGWMLTQGGTPVGLIRRVNSRYRVRTVSANWDAPIRRRGRVGWQLEFARSGEPQPAIHYVPRAVLQGGTLDLPGRERRYRLRAPIVRDNWRLTATTRGESVQIAFRRGGRVPAFRKHVQLEADFAHEPLLAGVILAASVAIVAHYEYEPIGGGAGGG